MVHHLLIFGTNPIGTFPVDDAHNHQTMKDMVSCRISHLVNQLALNADQGQDEPDFLKTLRYLIVLIVFPQIVLLV